MTRIAPVCAAAILATGCGKMLHHVNKGPPQYVLRQATESPSLTVFQASRRSQTRVELKVKHLREASVARTVVYGSSESFTESGSILWELIELPFGLLISFTALLDFSASVPPTAGQIDLSGEPAFVMINPFQRVLSVKIRVLVPSDRIAFKDPTRHRAYNVKLPVEGVTVSYRILDDARATIASGSGRTDMFGAIAIDGVNEAAVGIEATYDGTTAVVPIKPQ
ncbi:MAG: hypothetical protein H0T46_08455 [Deltaproteobacteria bacterium]|nr:hypothetical protein [Deltaproteobacteria bacterium]